MVDKVASFEGLPWVPESNFRAISYTLPWEPFSLYSFLRLAGKAPRFFWENHQYDESFAGFGIAAKLSAKGPNRFLDLSHSTSAFFSAHRHLYSSNPPPFLPKLFGGFSFDETPPFLGSPWQKFPPSWFVLPRYMLTRIREEAWLTVAGIFPLDMKIEQAEIALKDELWEMPSISDQDWQPYPPPTPLSFEEVQPYAHWERLVSKALKDINSGQLHKVVLSHVRSCNTQSPIEPLIVLERLESRFPDCFRFLLEPEYGTSFFGASPELLANVTKTSLHTMALAGSLRRGQTLVEDQQLGGELMRSQKNRAEHQFVIKEIERSLAQLVVDFNASEKPELMALNNVQHLLTPIFAKLKEPGQILRVIQALHPTPAVGGLPRKEAISFIARHEDYARGWYSGPVGWLDSAGNGLFAVALRSGLSLGREARIFAGAGIVAESDPEKEWLETQWKFEAIQNAIGGR